MYQRYSAFSLIFGLYLVGLSFGCTKRQAPVDSPTPAAPNIAASPHNKDSKVSAAAEATASPVVNTSTATSAERVVHLYIWANYASPEVLGRFTAKTGIRVIQSNYASNEELLAKLQAGATGYDLAVPSDYMVSIMNKLNLLETLDKAKLPNSKNLDPLFLGKGFDPDNSVSLPFAWSITGIGVNTAIYKDAVNSWSDLLNNPKASGKISMLDDVRETIGAALKSQGFSLNSMDKEQLQKAKDLLTSAKKHIKSFNSSPADALISGDIWLAHMYGQEALLAARATGGKLQFVIPKEGGTLALDNLVILKSAQHKDEAHQLINFLLEVQNNVDFVMRMAGGPVLRDTKAKLPADLVNNAAFFPNADLLNRCEMLQDVGALTSYYDRMWTEIKVSSH